MEQVNASCAKTNNIWSWRIWGGSLSFNIANCGPEWKSEILPSIVNIVIYATEIDVISFNSHTCYSNVKIILKITITEVSCITLLFVLIKIAMNYGIHDVRKNEFVIPSLKQLVVNSDVFI